MTGISFPRTRTHFAMQLLAAAAACTMAGTVRAQAEPPPPVPEQSGPAQPLSFGLSQTLMHESNLFRSDDRFLGPAQEDLVSTTALNFALDQPLGRQRVHGTAALQLNRYREHDELDNTGHELGMQLDWETIADLSGVLGVQSTRHQYRIGLDTPTASPGVTGRNMESVQAAYFQGRLGGMGLWALQGGLNGLKRSYSNDTFARGNDLSQWGGEGGVAYRPSPDLVATVLAKYDRIDRKDAMDDVGRKSIGAGLVWQASGASRFDLRIARAREAHSVEEDRSFWTGGIGWDWAPSAKLTFRTQLLRDTEGASGNVATAEAAMPTVPAGDLLRDAFIWTARWAATAKINLNAVAQWSQRKLGPAPDVDEAKDRTTSLSLGVRYSPVRALELGCDVSHERRDTNTGYLLLTHEYDSTSAGCILQFWFR